AHPSCTAKEHKDLDKNEWIVTGYSCTGTAAQIGLSGAASGNYTARVTPQGASISVSSEVSNTIRITIQSGSPSCPFGNYVGPNCSLPTPPADTSAFVYQNSLYSSVPADVCPLSGSYYDGAHCFVTNVPWGTKAFEYNGALYYSAAPKCALPGSSY